MPLCRADDTSYTLLSNGSATGASVKVRGGEYTVFFEGTLGGATVSLQIQTPSGGWSDIDVYTGATIRYTTIPRAQTGVLLPACDVRAALTGGTPSGINVTLVGAG